MALLKLYRGAAAPAAEVGKIWFDTTENVIKVCTAAPEGAEATWESYGLSNTDLAALVARVATLEGAVKTINETTLPALKAELKKYTDDAVAVETGRATAAEKALADRLDIVEGEATVEGSIKKALADAKAYTDEAKAAVIGDATEAGNTLGKLEKLINDVDADAKTYSVVKVTEGLGTNIKEAYKLVDEDGTQVGALIEIEKDDSLVDVVTTTDKAGNQVVKFTYNLADGTSKEVTIDLSAYVTESEYGDGLQVVDHVISVKKDADSESFLTVGANGVKLAGVQDAIDAAEAAAKKYTDDEIAALDANVTSAATYTVTDEEGVESTVNHKVRVQVVEENGVITGVNVTESDIASAKTVREHEIVVSAALNDLNARVDGHATRLDELEAGLGAVEHTTVSDGDNDDFVTITETTEGSHKNYAVSATVVKGAKDNAGLATDAYVREQIAAAALVWETGSFVE